MDSWITFSCEPARLERVLIRKTTDSIRRLWQMHSVTGVFSEIGEHAVTRFQSNQTPGFPDSSEWQAILCRECRNPGQYPGKGLTKFLFARKHKTCSQMLLTISTTHQPASDL